jgi:DnaJ-class molecular chaperone
MPQQDYYEVLGVGRRASEDDIKRAYRRLAKKHHPDRNRHDPKAEERFKEVQEAYDVLGDAEKRSLYDRFGHAGVNSSASGAGPGGGGGNRWSSGAPGGFGVNFDDLKGGGFGVDSIFERFFGAGGGPSASRSAPRSAVDQAVEHPIQLSFEEAVKGVTKPIVVSGPGMGQQSIDVKIPPGVDEGSKIRVRGKGSPPSNHGPAADLILVISVSPHRFFRRDGMDIYLDVPVTFVEAALGTKITLPTLDGPTSVTVPPGTGSGKRLRLQGKGVTGPGQDRRGDQYCVIQVAAPAELSDKQRELLEQLQATGLEDPRLDRGW